MSWRWGEPANPGELRFHTSTLLSKPRGEKRREVSRHYIRHRLARWFGVSIGSRFFIGVMRFDETGYENVPSPPTQEPQDGR